MAVDRVYSQRTPGGDVFVVNTDGSGLRNLTRNAAHDGLGSWSPSGKRIVFDNAGGDDIYVVDDEVAGDQLPGRTATRMVAGRQRHRIHQDRDCNDELEDDH